MSDEKRKEETRRTQLGKEGEEFVSKEAAPPPAQRKKEGGKKGQDKKCDQQNHAHRWPQQGVGGCGQYNLGCFFRGKKKEA